MDVLSNFSSRSFAPLAHLAQLSGFPGKLGEEGSNVWNQFLEGKEREIKAYCETDVTNTYLMYLRYLKLTGKASNTEYKSLISEVKNCIMALLGDQRNSKHLNHWRRFLKKWNKDVDV